MRIKVSANTSQGKREYQQDTFIDDPPLFAVFDGMGGMDRGGEASRISKECFSGLRSVEDIHAAFTKANKLVREKVSIYSGSTAVVCLIIGDKLHVFWSGDSRAYLNHRQITKDHETGGMIIASIGVSKVIEYEYDVFSINKGDNITLCSDGAYGDHGDRYIKTLAHDMDHHVYLKSCVDRLPHSDNCTIIHISIC